MDKVAVAAFSEKVLPPKDDILPEDKHTAQKLTELRRRHRLSPEEMSAITGVPADVIRRLESGKAAVPASAVFLISYSMGVAPDELMDIEDVR